MTLLLVLAAAVFGWSTWRSGRFRAPQFGDVAAVVLALCGVRLLSHGDAPLGLAALAGAGGWAWWRRRPPTTAGPAYSIEEARGLLDLPAGADRATIERAHRRLIARVHPDAGGSTELARAVNGARDALIAELNRRPPRAS